MALHHVLIRNGKVLDGTGAPWFNADVAMTHDSIVAMGDLKDHQAQREIDASDKFVTPGFVEEHSHADTTFLVDPKAQSAVRQGMTTMAVGLCGYSAAPISPDQRQAYQHISRSLMYDGLEWSWQSMGEYLDRLRAVRPSVNVLSFVGHLPVRMSVMGHANRPADQKERVAMRAMVEQALEQGARGFTTALNEETAVFADTQEIIELAKALRPFGWAYHTHMRDYGPRILEAVEEAIQIAETAEVPLVISHMYPNGRDNWGKSQACIELVEGARDRGMDVGYDVTPWLRGGAGIGQVFPPWARSADIVEQLRDDKVRARLANDIERGGDWPGWLRPEWDEWLICKVGKRKHLKYMGKSIAQVAEELGLPPAEAAVQLYAHDDGQYYIAPLNKCDEDIDRLLQHPLGVPIADAFALAPEGALANRDRPNSYGTFPRVLGYYVRERGVLTWQQAVQKLTSIPAHRLGLWDRGILRPGMKADLVVFDPQSVASRADYACPEQYPQGIEWVIVNGEPTITPEGHSGAQAGQVL